MDEIKIPDFMDEELQKPEPVREKNSEEEASAFVFDITKGLEAFLETELEQKSEEDKMTASTAETKKEREKTDAQKDKTESEKSRPEAIEEHKASKETARIKEDRANASELEDDWDSEDEEEDEIPLSRSRADFAAARAKNKTRKKTGKEPKASLSAQLKEKKIPTSTKELRDYIDWDKWNQSKKVVLPLLYIALALLLILGASMLIKYHTWKSYKVVAANDEEDTMSYSYTYVGKNVLRYGIDSARLMDEDYNIIWSDSYVMSNPSVEICGNTFCIYDKGGSALVTYNQNGRIGSAASELPIVKASVAGQGVAAVICESSTETWIKYYSTDGSTIASFRTDMDSPGYPMDIALSPDGLAMTVSYAFVEAGEINTQVAFYNFGSIGQNLVDNLIKVETFEDVLAPQVEYVKNDSCVVFFEDGFRVFEGVRKPTEVGVVTLDDTILSYDVSDGGVVIVQRNSSGAGYLIKLFNFRGRNVFSEEFDFAYNGMTVDSDKILFYNNQEMMLYSMAGVCKFEGAINEGNIKTAMDLGGNRYLIVTDQGIRTIRLR